MSKDPNQTQQAGEVTPPVETPPIEPPATPPATPPVTETVDEQVLAARKAQRAAEKKLADLDRELSEIKRSSMSAEELQKLNEEENARLKAEILKTKTIAAATRQLNREGIEIDDNIEEILDAFQARSEDHAEAFGLAFASTLRRAKEQGKAERDQENALRQPTMQGGFGTGKSANDSKSLGEELAKMTAKNRGYIKE